jgi:hypothetical protein
MQHMRFMVLTGHLDDYSLPGLIKMLHDQRKTGRLQVDYAESPAAFYFEEGRLVDAKIGDLRGLEAVYLALSLAGASFNFNPLIKPPERSVEEREQRLIQGLLDVPSGGASDIPDTMGRERALPSAAPAASTTSLQLPAADSLPAVRTQVEERLIAEVGAALASHSKRFGRERAFYAAVIALLLLFAFVPRMREDAAVKDVPSIDAKSAFVTSRTTAESRPSQETASARDESVPSSPVPVENRMPEQPPPPGAPDHAPAKKAERPSKHAKALDVPEPNRKNEAKTGREKPDGNKEGRTVKVVLRVERGRVLRAVVQNPHAGMESFEALALRIARQRQYPKDFSGSDVLQIDVKP